MFLKLYGTALCFVVMVKWHQLNSSVDQDTEQLVHIAGGTMEWQRNLQVCLPDLIG